MKTWMKLYILAFQMASDLDPAIDGHILLGDKFNQIFPPELERLPLDNRIHSFSAAEEKEV
jgi:N-terminal acetyltransferase B complex non-catalytic subunit